MHKLYTIRGIILKVSLFSVSGTGVLIPLSYIAQKTGSGLNITFTMSYIFSLTTSQKSEEKI